ncbi:PIG-L family deacetylase [Pedobacter sp.]|uniref:PIG-L family deacetylase n=1 Tax=Pedobacter sp. TaxID=1411316 RepID=UPI003D7F8592
MSFRSCRAFLLLLIAPYCLHAQDVSMDAATIKQGLEALNVSGSVLYLAAHPDDENTRLLAYLAKEKKVRTGYLSLTRGDGGQNLIGTEQADYLGLLRTQELLAARRVDGAEQFFTRANDFGFSTNPEESFKIWDKQKILSDVVWVIRKFQPDIIITRFPPDSRAGHGHHTASAMLAQEAFKAAADPRQFPEQLKLVKPWQVTRVVWNTFNFGGNNTTSEEQLKIDVGGYNVLLGKSYGELAAASRSKHRSQGFGSAAQRGTAHEYFYPLAGKIAKADLFEGIDLSLNRHAGMAKVQQLLDQVIKDYRVSNPAASLSSLLALRQAAKALPFKHELLDELILACAGIWIEANVGAGVYAVTAPIPMQLQVVNRVPVKLPLRLRFTSGSFNQELVLQANEMQSVKFNIPPSTLETTQPYWLAQKHPLGNYIVDSLALRGLPENPDPGVFQLSVFFGDEEIKVQRPLVYKFTDPARGEIYQPLVVAPPVTANLSETAALFSGTEPKTFSVRLRSFKDNVNGVLKPVVPEGWTVSPAQIDFSIAKKGAERNFDITVRAGGTQQTGVLSLQLNVDGKTYQQGLERIDFEHIPLQTVFPEAEIKLAQANLKILHKRIGYISGAGDLVPQALKQVGYEVTPLSVNEVLYTNLSRFDAIVTGVRLYNVNNQVSAMQPRLMKYVEEGGTLLVQYNVNNPLKIDELGPYPFQLSRNRVTDEQSPVIFLAPDHQVLNYPNKITVKDFEGWVQERGLYFTTAADPKYTSILAMNDPGQAPQNGSLIVANYGKGKYVYTGLSFFRELPAGVPGAFRLFVNLIAKREN